MLIRKANEVRPFCERNAARLPHTKVSCVQSERFPNLGYSDAVDEFAMRMLMSHDPIANTELEQPSTINAIDSNNGQSSKAPMVDLAKRIRARMKQLGMEPVDLRRAMNVASGKLGNWISEDPNNNRTPRVRELMEIAKALRTSTDWLLGLSEAPTIDVATAMQRLLELDGMQPAKAEVIALTAARAVELLSAAPGDGDAHTRAILAAQMAWQSSRSQSKPS
jgi:transcriptional regulator with XRE-family HTH domain